MPKLLTNEVLRTFCVLKSRAFLFPLGLVSLECIFSINIIRIDLPFLTYTCCILCGKGLFLLLFLNEEFKKFLILRRLLRYIRCKSCSKGECI